MLCSHFCCFFPRLFKLSFVFFNTLLVQVFVNSDILSLSKRGVNVPSPWKWAMLWDSPEVQNVVEMTLFLTMLAKGMQIFLVSLWTLALGVPSITVKEVQLPCDYLVERLERGKETDRNARGGLPIPIPVGTCLAQVPDKYASEEGSRWPHERTEARIAKPVIPQSWGTHAWYFKPLYYSDYHKA